MELIIATLQSRFEGFMVSLNESEHTKPLALINGNKPDFLGPIILLSLDQDIVYALSRQEIISRILYKGPQQLVTTKEMGHNLFEHGMKASLGKIKIMLNTFLTALESFYTLAPTTPIFQIVQGKDPTKLGCIVTPYITSQGVLLASSGFELKEPEKYEISEVIATDMIRSYVTVKLKPKKI